MAADGFVTQMKGTTPHCVQQHAFMHPFKQHLRIIFITKSKEFLFIAGRLTLQGYIEPHLTLLSSQVDARLRLNRMNWILDVNFEYKSSYNFLWFNWHLV